MSNLIVLNKVELQAGIDAASITDFETNYKTLASVITEIGFILPTKQQTYTIFKTAVGMDWTNVQYIQYSGPTGINYILYYQIDNASFSGLSLSGKGYAFAIITNILLASENDWLLFKNPAGSGKLVRLFEQVVAIPDSASTLRSTIRIYKNPTVTANGTPIVIGGIRNGQTASVCQAFFTPTTSAKGTLVQVYGATNDPVQRVLDMTRYVEQGDSLLITAAPTGATTNHSFSQGWAEV